MPEPITGLCIVADPYKCPPKHDLIFRSYDKRDDCDLWKDGMFRAKITRYICITRAYDPLTESLHGSVMTDLIIQNERDIPPVGYVLIEKTSDTGEKAIKKKQICVKMVPRASTITAITDLIILSKSKNAPFGFFFAGDINGLAVCMKMGNVPSDESLQDPMNASSSPAHGYMLKHAGSQPATRFPRNMDESPNHNPSNGMSGMSSYSDVYGLGDTSLLSPVFDVPFHLHAKFFLNGLSKTFDSTRSKSLTDIENEFSYSFSLEYSVVQQLPS